MNRKQLFAACVACAALAVTGSTGQAQDSFGGGGATQQPQQQPTPQQQYPQQGQQSQQHQQSPYPPPGGYPPQGKYPPSQNEYPWSPPHQGAAAPQPYPSPDQPDFALVVDMEAEDFGVAPVNQLRNDPMHGPTPTRIPGGRVITTEALYRTMHQHGLNLAIFDVLGGTDGLPGAQYAIGAAQGGHFNDQTQKEFGNYLQQTTGGNKNMPVVFYCQSVYCWMSYNAALRAINMGYTQVLWYRGGIEAWMTAGLPTYSRLP